MGAFRSISVKIFAIAAVLLAMMAAASLWAVRLTDQVHHQLTTLSAALFPMTLRIDEARAMVLAEAEVASGPADACRATAAAQARRTAALIAEAQRLRAMGAAVAVLERNRLELARLEPLFDELAAQQDRLAALRQAACAGDGEARAAAAAQAADVARRAGAIAGEIDAFVATGAALVARNQGLAERVTLIMTALAALVGLMLAWLVARGLTRPILRLQAGAHAVGQGRLDTEIPVTSRDEIGDVTAAFNTMIGELREKARITATFGQYVDPRVVAGLMAGDSDRAQTGEKQIATLFFSDIAGFTPLAERLAPRVLVELINAYFAEMSDPIRARAGVIDKYIGDAIMAFWVPPFADPASQAADACLAALDQLARLEGFAARIPDLIGIRQDVPRIDIRIGIATGEVVVGSIGSDQAKSFTAMGDTVNFGSRLEGANKAYGTRVLIDRATRDAAGAAIAARRIDRLAVAGRAAPVDVFELLGPGGALDPAAEAAAARYEAALADYQAGDWPAAERGFAALVADVPQDGAAIAMLARIRAAGRRAPPDWAGVTRLTSK